MSKFKKIISLALVFALQGGSLCLAQNANTEPVYMNSGNVSNVIQAGARSERIPAGTALKMRLETPVNSYNTTLGDTFRAMMVEDIRIGTKVVIPAGTLVRGRAGEVKKNSYLSRGGVLNLTFDHVVTSMGKQLPLAVKISNSKYLTRDGSLAAGGGYLNAVGKSIDQGCNFLVNASEKSVDLGKSFWQGYPVIVTVPVGTAVGLVGAGGIFAVKSTVALFKKGENVRLVPGDIIEVTLKDPLDVPLY